MSSEIECTWNENFSVFSFASHMKKKSHKHETTAHKGIGKSLFCNIFAQSSAFSLSLLAFMCNLSLKIEGFLYLFHLEVFFLFHTRIVPKINHLFSLNGKSTKSPQFFFFCLSLKLVTASREKLLLIAVTKSFALKFDDQF